MEEEREDQRARCFSQGRSSREEARHSRHFRREVTHCELFESVKALLAASADFFARHNREPQRTLSIIASKAAKAV